MSKLIIDHSRPAAPGRGESGWDQLAGAIRLAWRTYSTRSALLGMTDPQLADIGLARAAAVAEAARMPWDTASLRQQRRSASSRWSAVSRLLRRARARHLVATDHPEAVCWGG